MRRVFEVFGVILFQLVAILSVTFLIALVSGPLMADPQTQSGFYVLLMGLSIILGVCLAGWLAFRFGWLKGQPRWLPRLAGALLGAYLPLLMVLLIEKMIPAGHPAFTIAIFTGILGFYLPAWLKR